jgi:hypothetical protein
MVVNASKVTFRTLNVLKVTFRASSTATGEPLVTPAPPVTRSPSRTNQPANDRQVPAEEPHPSPFQGVHAHMRA